MRICTHVRALHRVPALADLGFAGGRIRCVRMCVKECNCQLQPRRPRHQLRRRRCRSLEGAEAAVCYGTLRLYIPYAVLQCDGVTGRGLGSLAGRALARVFVGLCPTASSSPLPDASPRLALSNSSPPALHCYSCVCGLQIHDN